MVSIPLSCPLPPVFFSVTSLTGLNQIFVSICILLLKGGVRPKNPSICFDGVLSLGCYVIESL